MMRFLGILALLAVFLSTPCLAQQPVIPCAAAPVGASTMGCSQAIAPLASTQVEAAHVLKASPGHLFNLRFTETAGNAGYVLVLNTTAVPTGGSSVVPLECVAIAANGSVSIPFNGGTYVYPERFSAGIVVIASASGGGCTTYTTSSQPSGWFSAEVQ